ncbi:hypothetical protein BDD12DRAFT_746052 [Trichophaea hybrida]|nr:hypothetical protein BDD12DRAFT_746052 [Trichophaea hybrida]
MPIAPRRQYDTHFYCALCGGPFAGVLRTPVNPAFSRYSQTSDPDDNGDNFNINNGADRNIHCDDFGYPADLDPHNEFNFDGEENQVIPEEVVEQDMGYAARRSRKLRQRAEELGQRRGVMSEKRTVRQAYDGRRIAVKHLKWTKNLRALIHYKAVNQPQNWQRYIQDNGDAYLTGRGLIRQSENWADAFASVDEIQDDPADKYPVFSELARLENTYGFHLYQELGGRHIKSFISSIPFHDECWTLLDLAIEETGHEKGLEDMNEAIELDHMWRYLRSLITVSGEKQQVEQTRTILQEGNREEVITRLGEIDYREAQGSGEGWHWRHEDGCHWLAADPSAISVRDNPLKSLPNTSPLPFAPRSAIVDPFMNLPPETILEISNYLSSSDIFSLKIASPAVLHVALPNSYYRRFLREEFKYIPKLRPEIDKYEELIRQKKYCPIDWRGSFERLRRLIRTPRLSGHPDDEDYGKEWDEVDICLKNRSRIWKIVKPIAEAIVETSSMAIRELHGAPIDAKTGVVRGYVGVRSSQEGSIHTAYVGNRGRPNGKFDVHSGEESEDIVPVEVEKIRLWCDKLTFCGLEFSVLDQELGVRKRMFGRQGTEHTNITVMSDQVLAGFAFCFADGIICGAQVFFRDDETKSGTSFLKRVGRWGGSLRKIAVPPDWRKFVGLTGFLNSSGFFETIGVLEENGLGTEEAFGLPREPPVTVPLSHDESSLWKNKLPPSTVGLHEREGVDIDDWRLCGSEWEIWEAGFHEDGVDFSTTLPPSSGRLKTITGYYDERFLRGLEFNYVDRAGRAVTKSLMGTKGERIKQSSMTLQEGESIIASVINFSDEGVHGILFVTDRAQVSGVFGPRYLGKHKVFAPPPDRTADGRRSRGTEYREEIPGKIFGVHGLYDHEDKRFLQLGLILPLEEGFSVFPQLLSCSIPFDEKDEHLGVWDDGPPPEGWIIGTSPTFVEVDMSCKAQRPFNDYIGWVKLESVRKIIFYRNMRGIKFKCRGGGNDKFFGHVEDKEGSYRQTIEYDKGERIIGVAVLADEEEVYVVKAALGDGNDNSSIISASSRSDERNAMMEKIFFITNFNHKKPPFPVKRQITSPEYLKAVKFDFNFDQLISWAPIFATEPKSPSLSQQELTKNALFHQELTKLIRFPWKACDKNITEDRDIPETSHVASTLFEDNEAGRVDGLKGYVTQTGRFCGLLLRRNGKWAKEAFGDRSAYETTFELNDGESIDSIFIPEVRKELKSNALALSTSHGRTTPWIGKVEDDAIPNHRKVLPGYVCVGIFGAQKETPSLFNGPQWDMVGLLYRPTNPNSPISTPRHIQREQPQNAEYHRLDKATGLRWLNDNSNLNPNLRCLPLQAYNPYMGSDPKNYGRAISVFEPSKLLQVRVWSSRLGVCSLRFRGTADVGIITVGNWPEAEGVNLSRNNKMSIDGPGGERILRIKVAFQRLESEDRIIGLCIETSYGRAKTILSPEMSPEKPIDLADNNVKSLECPGTDEIAGLHGIFGPYNIHDMGLVLRGKPHVQCP